MKKLKDSGVEWIGEIPADWKVIKNKYLLSLLYSGGTPSVSNNDFYCFEGGTPFVSISDMSTVDYVLSTQKRLTDSGLKDKNLKVLPIGTIMYSIYATVGAVSELKIEAAISQAILALQVNSKVDKSFYKYNLAAMKDYIFSNANGNTQFNLNAEKVKNFYFVLPNVATQHHIANYLDRKCAEIDAIIAKQQQIIEKLKEYKLSVITEAVTKGLDPNVPMKDSGVEWIGKVPENWQLSHIGNLVEMGSGGTPDRKKTEYWENGNIPWMSSGEINNEYIYSTIEQITELGLQNSNAKILPVNTVMLGLIGQGKTKGLTAILKNEVCCNQNLAYLIADEKYLHYRYLFYCFKAMYFYMRGLVGESQAGIYSYFLKKLYIPLPDTERQIKISDYLDAKCKAIKTTIAVRESIIERFTDYKRTLIYEIVTGKREV